MSHEVSVKTYKEGCAELSKLLDTHELMRNPRRAILRLHETLSNFGKLTIEYIQTLEAENKILRQKLEALEKGEDSEPAVPLV